MLEINHLCKSYKSKSGASVKALDDISLKFPKTGMVFILGKSGSGKSTLLNVLGGLDSFDSGEFYVKGTPVHNFKQNKFDSYRNTYVGFIFQEYNILDEFTVGQNIALAMQLQNQKPTSEAINKILADVDLDGLGDRKPNELSGGQKQRVAIARALIKNPQIIMADEPTGALDSKTGIQIFDVLKNLSRERLVIIVSHDREFSEKYADRIIEIKDGQVLSDVSCASGKRVPVQENVIYHANEITVKKNYVLTQKDLKEINEYLKHQKANLTIKSGKTDDYKGAGKGRFTKTDESKIVTDKSGFTLIKSKLPLGRAFKMGTSGLKHKKFKLVMTIFLSLISFSLLGMSISIALATPQSATQNALYDSYINFASFNKEFYDAKNKNVYYDPIGFDDSDLEVIKKETGCLTIPVYETGYGVSSDDVDEGPLRQHEAYVSEFSGYVLLNDDLKGKFTYVPGGKDPTNENEIAIPDYLAWSYADYGKGGLEQIKEPAELVNQKIHLDKEYTVTGIIDTGFDFSIGRYADIRKHAWNDPYSAEISVMMNELYSFKQCSIDACVLVTQHLQYATQKVVRVVAPFDTTDKSLIKKVVNFSYDHLALSEAEKAIPELSEATYRRLVLSDYISQGVRMAFNTMQVLTQVFLYVGLAFVVFSGLLLANFISNSITYQKKEIGILRAIGSRSADVFKIYFAESFVIATINFILSAVASWAIMTFAINPNISAAIGGFSIFSFGIIPILVVFGVSYLSAFAATYLPVKHIARKRPIEAIRNK
ncbi:MAG: ABC transporter ATP-binding protein/permease [Bacilli bacterium]|nr:ABC transporter ATP-binding protein/permease [Bacilli bacterium]